MSWRSTGILLATAAVFFGFIWFVERPIRLENLREADHAVFPGFDPGSVNYIEVKPRGAGEIHVKRSDSGSNLWTMTEPISYPAQGTAIETLLQAMEAMKWNVRIAPNELKDQPDAQEKYGFAQPLSEIIVHGSGAPFKLLVGQTSALGDQVYVELVGSPEIYLVGAAFLRILPWNKDQWRDISLLDVAHLSFDTIQVRSPGNADLEFQRAPAAGLWMMKKPVAARADSGRINELLAGLQNLRVKQFVSDDSHVDLDAYGLQPSPQTPALVLSFLKGSNLAAELQLGASLTNLTNFAFARRQNPSNIVVIERDPLRPWQASSTNFLDFHLISVSPDSIGSIKVEGEDRFTVRKDTTGQWQVQGATTFPADAAFMRMWLGSFTNIQTQVEKTVATDFAPYGLAHPLLEYVLQRDGTPPASNNPIAEIDFGTNNTGRVFERRPDESFVNYISADDFDRLPRVSWQLRDRRIWSFDSSNVISLTIHQLGAERKYLRDPLGEWTFAPGFHGPPEVNWLRLEEGVHRLGELRAVYWSGLGDAHWNDFGFARADFSVSLEVKNGSATETNTIAFGGSSPYTYPYASVTQNGIRWYFEFPVDLYENFVLRDMTIPPELRVRRQP